MKNILKDIEDKFDKHRETVALIIFTSLLLSIVASVIASSNFPFPYLSIGGFSIILLFIKLTNIRFTHLIAIFFIIFLTIFFLLDDIGRLIRVNHYLSSFSETTLTQPYLKKLDILVKKSNDILKVKKNIFFHLNSLALGNIESNEAKLSYHLQRSIFETYEKNTLDNEDYKMLSVDSNADYFAIVDSRNRVWISDSQHKLSSLGKKEFDEIKCITFSQNSEFIAIGRSSGLLEVFDVKKKYRVGFYKLKYGKIKDIFFDPENRFIIASTRIGKAIYLELNINNKNILENTHELIHNSDKGIENKIIYGSTVSSVYNVILTVGGDGFLKIWKFERSEPKKSVEIHEIKKINLNQASILKIKITSDGENFATYGKDGSIKTWQIFNDKNKDLSIKSIDKFQVLEEEEDIKYENDNYFSLDFHKRDDKDFLSFAYVLKSDRQREIYKLHLIVFNDLKNLDKKTKLASFKYFDLFEDVFNISYRNHGLSNTEKIFFIDKNFRSLHLYDITENQPAKGIRIKKTKEIPISVSVRIPPRNGQETLQYLSLSSNGHMALLGLG